jgi:hypothetical protein
MRRHAPNLVLAAAAVFALAACGEKPQVSAQGERKPDAKAFTGASANYVAPGWKAGDEASWQQQLRQRAQAQNEHARMTSKKSGS